MSIDGERGRDLAVLSVPMVGGLKQTGDPWLPFRLVDRERHGRGCRVGLLP